MSTVIPTTNKALLDYVLYLADNSMILGQRLSEWCGHGPALEQDIAVTNIALDLIGEARLYYQYAAELQGGGATEDDFPYKRDVRSWKNILLVELPNEDFAYTIVRQFLFDTFHYYLLGPLQESGDERLQAIARKTIKEATYHLKFSSKWMVRLGDGTDVSHAKMQTALDNRIMYLEEAMMPSTLEQSTELQGIAADVATIKENVWNHVRSVVHKATLTLPEDIFPQKGGKEGMHSEHLGYILSDLQYMQKTYPDSTW